MSFLFEMFAQEYPGEAAVVSIFLVCLLIWAVLDSDDNDEGKA